MARKLKYLLQIKQTIRLKLKIVTQIEIFGSYRVIILLHIARKLASYSRLFSDHTQNLLHPAGKNLFKSTNIQQSDFEHTFLIFSGYNDMLAPKLHAIQTQVVLSFGVHVTLSKSRGSLPTNPLAPPNVALNIYHPPPPITGAKMNYLPLGFWSYGATAPIDNCTFVTNVFPV